MKRIFNLLTILGVFCVGLASLQAQTTQKGSVQDQEFIIQKDRVIQLPKKLRSLEKMPSLPQPKALGTLEFPVAPFFLAIENQQAQVERAGSFEQPHCQLEVVAQNFRVAQTKHFPSHNAIAA